MYTYKHKKTGAVISTHGKVTSTNWELVKADKKAGKAADKKTNVKKEEDQEDTEE